MSRKLFITGTDTAVGKTYIATHLLRKLSASGQVTLGLKPIASGCKRINGKLVNDDALQLAAASSMKVDYDITNPFAFEPAIAPHLAAQVNQVALTSAIVSAKLEPALTIKTDTTIIEGTGGWLLPLNLTETLADYVIQQEFDILLVVGLRLGCLNHALLTARTIQSMGGKLIGWFANTIEPQMDYLEENIATLKKMMPVKMLNDPLNDPA